MLLRVLATVFAVMIVVTTGVAWTTLNSFEGGIKPHQHRGPGRWRGRRRDRRLLVGVDSRTDAHGNPLSAEELATLRAGDDVATNTDTIILIASQQRPVGHRDLDPRDSYVNAPGLGKMKINGVFGEVKLDTMKELIGERGHGSGRGRKRGIEGRPRGVDQDRRSAHRRDRRPLCRDRVLGFALITDALGGVTCA